MFGRLKELDDETVEDNADAPRDCDADRDAVKVPLSHAR